MNDEWPKELREKSGEFLRILCRGECDYFIAHIANKPEWIPKIEKRVEDEITLWRNAPNNTEIK